MKWMNGDQYEGAISNQNPDGYGIMHFADGNKYKGNWRVGVFDGKGKYTWTNGQQYSGNLSFLFRIVLKRSKTWIWIVSLSK